MPYPSLKQSLKDAIASDRARQMNGILTPWRVEKMRHASPRELFATYLLADGRRGYLTAYTQKQILESSKDAVLILECICAF